MRIDELDEWQGVTPELVTDWLLSHGWTQKPTQPKWWLKGDDGFLFDALTFDQVWFWAYALAAIYTNGNVQALLREINPRMRKGMPSQAAREVHGPDGGMWVACRGELGNGGTIVFVCFESDSEDGLPLAIWDCDEWEHWEVEPVEIENEWFFWPCDVSGNKVRWPTDPEGNML